MNNNNLDTKPHFQIFNGLRGVAAIILVFFHLAEPLASNRFENVVNHELAVKNSIARIFRSYRVGLWKFKVVRSTGESLVEKKVEVVKRNGIRA